MLACVRCLFTGRKIVVDALAAKMRLFGLVAGCLWWWYSFENAWTLLCIMKRRAWAPKWGISFSSSPANRNKPATSSLKAGRRHAYGTLENQQLIHFMQKVIDTRLLVPRTTWLEWICLAKSKPADISATTFDSLVDILESAAATFRAVWEAASGVCRYIFTRKESAFLSQKRIKVRFYC